MSVLKPRNRLVYFRVSEDEFQQFNQVRESMGARSISDLARSAMQLMIQDGHHQGTDIVTQRLSAIEILMSDLKFKLEQLAVSLEWRNDAATGSNRVESECNESNKID